MRSYLLNFRTITLVILIGVLCCSIPGAAANMSISHIDPVEITAGNSSFTLNVFGEGFTPDCTALWNGENQTTHYLSHEQLSILVPGDCIAVPGSVTITVYNSASGEYSGTLNMTVSDQVSMVDTETDNETALVYAYPSGMAGKFRSDLNNSGVYDDGGTSPAGDLIWNYTTGSVVYSSPTVADGVVYIGSDDHNLYAFDAVTGDLLWNYTTGRAVRSSPAVKDDVVYFGSDDGNIYALEAATGAFLWDYTTEEVARSSPAVANGIVYVGGNTCKGTALDAATGSLLWNYTVGSPPYTTAYTSSSPAVADGVVYVGNYDRNIYAFNAETGTVLWNYTTGNNVFSSPAVINGVVYIGSWDNNLSALDATTGDLLWNYSTGGLVTSSPAVANGVVYVGSSDNTTYALDATSGALLWKYTAGNRIMSSPAVANGIVYVASYDGNLSSLDASTGNLLWTYPIGTYAWSSPAVANGIVYIGSLDANLYAIGTSPENPPPSVFGLHTAATHKDRITWNWTDPSTPGFSHVMVYLDGVFRENVTRGTGSWTASGLSPDTPYTISTRTVGINGLVNQTWANSTAWTEPLFPSEKGWKFRSDLRNSGVYDDGGIRPGNGLLWKYLTENYLGGSPAVVNGVVYIPGYGDIYALDATTGTVVWDHPMDVYGQVSPAVANGVVYAGGTLSLYALDATDGHILWNYPTGGAVYSSPAVADGILYFGCNDHNLYALDASTGIRLWNYTAGDEVRSSPAVVNGVVYFGSRDHDFYALNAKTGELLWNYTTGNDIESSPAVVNGIAYIQSAYDKLYALDANSGELIWDHPMQGYGDSCPAVANGVVYVGSDDRNLYAFDAATGAPLWNYTTGGLVRSSPAVANGVVYAGSEDTKLYAFDAATGTLLWNYTTSAAIINDPVVANGVIYVQSINGYLYALVSYPDVPPASVTNLHVTANPGNRITWAWTDPQPIGFSTVMVYIDGVFQVNVTKGVQTYTATGLAPLTTHTIGTRTVGPTGLINGTWVNNTATTGPLSISRLDPQGVVEGSPSFVLDVYGTGFTNNSTIFWNDAGQPTQYLQPAHLAMAVPAELVAYSGRVNITVYDSSSKLSSNSEVFTITDSPSAMAWKFRSRLNNTGVYDDGGWRPENKLLWNFTTGAGVSSSPAVVAGVLYIGSQDGNLYALDASTGALLWNYTVEEPLDYVSSSPAVAQGVVYIGGMRVKVHALDAKTGAQLWEYKAPTQTTTRASISSSPAVENGVVYIGNFDGNVYAFNATNGDLVWNYTTSPGYYVFSSPAVEDGIVYIGNWNSTDFTDGFLYALNASTGTLLWSYPRGGQTFSSPAVANGVVYFTSTKDNSTYALNAKTGAFIWKTTTDYSTGSLRSSYSSPAIVNGVVYIGSNDNNTYALNASTGALLWTFTTGNRVLSSPAVANGVVYVGSYDNNTYALNASTGALIWTFTTGNRVLSSPAVANGVVYVGSYDNNTYAIGSILENPPDSVTGLHPVVTEQDRITWNWTDPGSPGFSHVMVYLDGVFKENVVGGVQTYTATGLTPATAYTIGTRTVGTTGLVNQTWVNITTRTAAPSGPGILWVASYPREATIYLDGIVRGRTNQFVFNISPGAHNLTLAKGGYRPATSTVTVPAGLKVLAPITLQPDGSTLGSGTLYVASYPSDALILIDGAVAGRTDQFVYEVPAGNRNLTLTKTGYRPKTIFVQVPAGDLKVLPPTALERL